MTFIFTKSLNSVGSVTESFTKEGGTMSPDTPSKGFAGSSIEDAGDKEDIVGAARDRLAEDVSSLRADMTKMHESLSNFVSETGGHAAGTARSVGQAVASQVGSTASSLANTGAGMASSATEQLKTYATELEGMARKNPLGALAGPLAVGIVIGLIVRGRG
jgi:ElaB/YqjD/DUF883 family membrane-anchored ribosome-binding protein